MTKFLNFKNIFLGIFLSLIVFSLALAATKMDIWAEERETEVVLKWDKVLDASKYKVYRDGEAISDWISDTAYTDKKFKEDEIKEAKQFTYTVIAQDNKGQEIARGEIRAGPKCQPEKGKICIGAPFPGEPKKVDLIDHIMHAHAWAAGIGSLLAVFMIIFAGFKYTTSAGNPEALQDAKDTIIGALIGLAIIFLTYLLLQVFGARVERLEKIE